jgi:hypothetical protein
MRRIIRASIMAALCIAAVPAIICIAAALVGGASAWDQVDTASRPRAR